MRSAQAEGVAKKPRKSAQAKCEGFSLSYAPLAFPEGRRTSARAEKLILGFEGRLKSDRPIAFRRTVLPPGSYYVSVGFETVERDDKRVKEWSLSVHEKPDGAEEKKRAKKSTKDSSSADDKDPGLVLRVPLRFQSKKPKEQAEKLSAEMNLRSAGKQVRLTLRAGALVAVANWRVVLPEASKPGKGDAKKPSPRTKKKKKTSKGRAKEER